MAALTQIANIHALLQTPDYAWAGESIALKEHRVFSLNKNNSLTTTPRTTEVKREQNNLSSPSQCLPTLSSPIFSVVLLVLRLWLRGQFLQEFHDSTKALQALVLDAFLKDVLTLPSANLKKNYTEQTVCVSLKEHLGAAMGVIEKAQKHIQRMSLLGKVYNT
eukprot:6461831-Amphidinium_carterae.2